MMSGGHETLNNGGTAFEGKEGKRKKGNKGEKKREIYGDDGT